MNTYRMTFNKKPEEITVDLRTLKNGSYFMEGEFSETYWAKVCKNLELEPKGQGSAKLELEVSQPIIHIKGEVKTTFERQCVRTLEMFEDTQTTRVDEHVTWKESMAEEGEVFFTDELAFDMGDFIEQQIVLGFDLHPIKDRSYRGGVVLSDGFEETPAANPFAVLKELKKS